MWRMISKMHHHHFLEMAIISYLPVQKTQSRMVSLSANGGVRTAHYVGVIAIAMWLGLCVIAAYAGMWELAMVGTMVSILPVCMCPGAIKWMLLICNVATTAVVVSPIMPDHRMR